MGYFVIFLIILAGVAYGFSLLRKATEATSEDEAKAISQADARLTEIDRNLPGG